MVVRPMRTPTHNLYSHEQELEEWKRTYQEMQRLISDEMEGLGGTGAGAPAAALPPGAERRRDPRYPFMPESNIYAHMGPRAFRVLNISIGGLAFHSDIQFSPGDKLLMSALGMIALDVEVLSCEMEETDAEMMEYQYRVRAKFGTHVNGYQVYVLAREMHLQNMKEQNGETPMLGDDKP